MLLQGREGLTAKAPTASFIKVFPEMRAALSGGLDNVRRSGDSRLLQEKR